MEISLGILFSVVVVLYPVIGHLIPAVLLFVAGLFTNLVQAICYVCIWPISAKSYTRLNGVVKELDWRVLLGIIDCCAGVRILECIEPETSQLKQEEFEPILSHARSDADPLMKLVLTKVLECIEQENSLLTGEEHELVITNARSEADCLLELVFAQWSGCLGSLLAVVKTLARYSTSDPKDFPLPFWSSVILERTGFTRRDLLAAQRPPVCCKDWVYAVRHAYSAVPAIYVITVAIPKNSTAFSLESVIKGAPSVVHVYIERHVTKKWSETDDAVKKWCTEILAAKDELLDKHIAEHTFGDKGFLAIGRPLQCFLVISIILLWWAIKFNFVCRTTLLVLGAALFTGRVLALFGCGVLSMLQCVMRAAIANITWSEHLKPICDPICLLLVEVAVDCIMILPWDKPWW